MDLHFFFFLAFCLLVLMFINFWTYYTFSGRFDIRFQAQIVLLRFVKLSGYREKGDPARGEAEVLNFCMLDIRKLAHERKLMNDGKIQNSSARHRFEQAAEDADRSPDAISCCSPASSKGQPGGGSALHTAGIGRDTQSGLAWGLPCGT